MERGLLRDEVGFAERFVRAIEEVWQGPPTTM